MSWKKIKRRGETVTIPVTFWIWKPSFSYHHVIIWYVIVINHLLKPLERDSTVYPPVIPSVFGHRHLQTLHPLLHWVHAELSERPAGVGGRCWEGQLQPDLSGDGVPPSPSRLPPPFQRHLRQACWVCDSLCDWWEVHFCGSAVSVPIMITATRPGFVLSKFHWERNGTSVHEEASEPPAWFLSVPVEIILSLPLFLRRSCASWRHHMKHSIFWEVISYHKYSESFYQSSHMCGWSVERLVNVFHSWVIVWKRTVFCPYPSRVLTLGKHWLGYK